MIDPDARMYLLSRTPLEFVFFPVATSPPEYISPVLYGHHAALSRNINLSIV